MNRIKALREDRDLRQIDVSLATGIDQRTLSNYETGKTNPDSFAIIKLAKYFNVSTDYLLGFENTKEITTDEILKRINKIKSDLDNISEEIKKL